MSGLRDIQKKKANRAGTSSSPTSSYHLPLFLSLYLKASYFLPSTHSAALLQHFRAWRPKADSLAVEAKKDAPKGLQRTNSEMEMIAEKAALLSTHEEDEIPRLTSDQPSPIDEIRDPGLSIITPGENNVDPLSNSTSNSTKMSEKARGKMRAVDPTTLETEEIDVGDEELLGIAAAGVGPSGYVPTQEWVSSWQKGYVFFFSPFFLVFLLLSYYTSPLSSSMTRFLPFFLIRVSSTIHDCTRTHQFPDSIISPSLHTLLASRLATCFDSVEPR